MGSKSLASCACPGLGAAAMGRPARSHTRSDLGSPAAAAPAERLVLGLLRTAPLSRAPAAWRCARIEIPSMHTSERSSVGSSVWSLSRALSQSPSRVQRRKALVRGLPGAEALGKVAPRRPGLEDPERRVQHEPVALPLDAPLAVRGGKRSSIRAHCPSFTARRCAAMDRDCTRPGFTGHSLDLGPPKATGEAFSFGHYPERVLRGSAGLRDVARPRDDQPGGGDPGGDARRGERFQRCSCGSACPYGRGRQDRCE